MLPNPTERDAVITNVRRPTAAVGNHRTTHDTELKHRLAQRSGGAILTFVDELTAFRDRHAAADKQFTKDLDHIVATISRLSISIELVSFLDLFGTMLGHGDGLLHFARLSVFHFDYIMPLL